MPLTPTVEIFSHPMQLERAMANSAFGLPRDFAMVSKKATRFPRTARLLRHADFERVYKQGRRHFSASMTVFYWPRPEEVPSSLASDKSAPRGLRVGFTVGRALGGAVQRNRIKRRLREAVRLSHPSAGVAADIVINPKKSSLTVEFSSLLNEISRAFEVIEQKLSRGPEAALNRKTGSRRPEAESQA